MAAQFSTAPKGVINFEVEARRRKVASILATLGRARECGVQLVDVADWDETTWGLVAGLAELRSMPSAETRQLVVLSLELESRGAR